MDVEERPGRGGVPPPSRRAVRSWKMGVTRSGENPTSVSRIPADPQRSRRNRRLPNESENNERVVARRGPRERKPQRARAGQSDGVVFPSCTCAPPKRDTVDIFLRHKLSSICTSIIRVRVVDDPSVFSRAARHARVPSSSIDRPKSRHSTTTHSLRIQRNPPSRGHDAAAKPRNRPSWQPRAPTPRRPATQPTQSKHAHFQT